MRFLIFLLTVFVYTIPVQILWWILYIVYYAVKVRLVERLEYERCFSEEGVFAGDVADVIETITNPTVLPVFFVDVESYIDPNLRIEGRDTTDSMQLIISRFHIPPHSKITRRFKVKCAGRGYYTMNTAVVFTKSLTVERVKNFEFNAELYVYPAVSESLNTSHPAGVVFGESMSSRRIVYDPFSLSGVRDYAFGDPFNQINFKATARSIYGTGHGIKVNRYDYCSDRVFMIYMDLAHPERVHNTMEYQDMMESALSVTAAFAMDALSNGYKVGFAANCHMTDGRQSLNYPVHGGEHHITELLREMAMIRMREGASFMSVLDGGVKSNVSNAEIYILTAREDDSADESIEMLKRYNTVTVIRL